MDVKNKKTSDLDLDKLTTEELRARVVQLEAHVKQLKCIIAKNLENKNDKTDKPNTKAKRMFNFKNYKKRRIAMKFLYLGWDYQGFATQEDTMNTIEAEIFKALTLTKIIESRQVSNYHRCGRTDKGVSAFSQVISLDVRTNLQEGPGVFEPPDYTGNSDTVNKPEIEYVQILNRVLPPEIRFLAWVPVDKEFSARFSCTQRTYKYYFPKCSLNLEKMNLAGKKLIGEHDFRNLCKMDVANGVVNYSRKILDVSVSLCEEETSNSSYNMVELTIVGTAFLWHQIRCIVAILFLIGQERESENIIDELLDVAKNPCKPQYCMASELPLVLFDCQYSDIQWVFDKEVIVSVIRNLQSIWTQHAVKSIMVRRMLSHFEALPDLQMETVNSQCDSLVMGVKTTVYKPLFEREVCGSLEERIEHYKNKRRKT